jgi:hypothetical protein
MEKPWKVIGAFAGVFVAGGVFGGLIALRLAERDFQAPVAPNVAAAPVAMPTSPVQPTSTNLTPPSVTPATESTALRKGKSVAQVQLPAGMAVQAPQLMRRYVDRLDLNAEQKERVHPLIVRATEDLRRQQQTNLRETGLIFQHLQEDLAKELTPKQRVQIEAMAEKQRQIIEQRERQQQEAARLQAEKLRNKPGQKPGAKDGVKPKGIGGKAAEESN